MLRVASGSEKGRRLRSLKSLRPTEEQVRISLFNSLGAKIKDKRFLDLFAGTGAVGIEALSRGAREAWFVDRKRKCVDIIKENLKDCHFEEKARVFFTDARRAITIFAKKGEKFDLIFLDPPYERIDTLMESLELLGETELLNDDGLCIVQHSASVSLPEQVGSLVKSNVKIFGNTALTFYRREND
ncbi:16S rRNA (guanine(966)-N(2))-methyltransferase RsmD [bacterium]|nr:16S rRNA (guanine(966)-N(2))-methyltransferase RsmD [bacterium]